VIDGDVAEYASNYLAASKDEIKTLLDKATVAGHLQDLKIVPVDVVRRYVSQFEPTKINAATGGLKTASRLAGKGTDVVNDLIYLSLIYSNPGYVPAAAAANLLLTAAQQGAFLAPNIARAGQLLVSGPKRVRDLVRAEVGTGATVSLVSDARTAVRKPAEIVGDVGDMPWRVSSLLHEAGRVGVIDSKKPWLDANDYKALEEFMTDKKYRPLLNDVSDRANQAVIDFNRLGSKERAFAKRLLFVWGFTRGAVRYPGRFILDHPIRSAAGTAAAYFGQDAIRDATVDDLPASMRGTVQVGDKVLQTRSFEPSSPVAGIAGTLTGDKDARTFLELAHPGVQALIRGAGRKDRFGYDAASYPESIKDNAEGLVPWVERGKDYIDPTADPDPLWPEDVTRLGRLKRDLRVVPIEIDREVGAEKRRRELSRQGRSKPKTRGERVSELLREERPNARKLGLPDVTREVRRALTIKAAIETHTEALEEQQSRRSDVQTPPGKRFKLTARQKAAAALMAMREVMPPSEFDYTIGKANLDALTDPKEVENFLEHVRFIAYNEVLEDWHRLANEAG
jgi:hypothetical protein